MVTELDLMSVFQGCKGLILRCPFFFSRETNGFGIFCPGLILIGVNFEELPSWAQIFENLSRFKVVYDNSCMEMKDLLQFKCFTNICTILS